MKRVLLVLTAIMLVFAVVGCNSNGAPTTVRNPGTGEGGDEGETPVVKVLEVAFEEDWAGIDLLDSVFSFADGDKIEANGKIIAVAGGAPEFIFNDKPGDWGEPFYQLSGITAGSEWSVDKSVNAANVTNIAGGSPNAIRIGGNNVTANSLVVVIEQIKVSRGTTVLVDLAEDLQAFDIDDADINLILPGAKGFQKAGGVTVKVVAK